MTSKMSNKYSYSGSEGWLQSMGRGARVWLAQTVINTYYSYLHMAYNFPAPNEIKSFSTHAQLKNRIFYPPAYKVGDKAPLFLCIHGGGFMLLTPACDGLVNAKLAKELNCIVISLDYSKAPAVKFPTPTNELVDTILDILGLGDETLSFDRQRVVLGGYSAGGNLAVSAAQSPKLQGKLAGVTSWYPATDFSDDASPKALLRPYDVEGEVDPLLNQLDDVKWAYLERGQDLKDARLSIVFTERDKLPKHVMVVGAQNDILCHEAWRMARQLAGLDYQCNWDDDQAMKFGFDRGRVRWLLVRGAKHAFTHFAGGKGEAEVKRKKQEEECFVAFKEFMQTGPFAAVS